MEGRDILDDEALTQCGRVIEGGFSFNDRPRMFRDLPETALSLVRGELPASTAVARAFGRAYEADSDACRHTSAGTLRREGFRVEHTPSKRNPDHVSVYWDHSDWNRDVARNFARCFGAPVVGGEDG